MPPGGARSQVPAGKPIGAPTWFASLVANGPEAVFTSADQKKHSRRTMTSTTPWPFSFALLTA